MVSFTSMCIRPFTKSLAPYLTAYLLLVSVGLPLNRVYCACVGEEWLTVVTSEHDCHHDAGDQSVHHHELDDATEHHEGHDRAAAAGCQSHDCGNFKQVIEPLDVDFFANWNFELTDLQSYVASLGTEQPGWLASAASVTSAPIRGPTDPPIASGRTLLIAYQTFLI